MASIYSNSVDHKFQMRVSFVSHEGVKITNNQFDCYAQMKIARENVSFARSDVPLCRTAHKRSAYAASFVFFFFSPFFFVDEIRDVKST